MKILLTGATGYIGKRLLPQLIDQNHEVVCCVRDLKRFDIPSTFKKHVTAVQVDFLKQETLKNIPQDIDGAYYLIHSMSAGNNYTEQELECAKNFKNQIEKNQAKHVVYLGGIVNEDKLSKHLTSRKNVEEELAKGTYNFTALRAGIVIGSGSASFEIMRDLVEKLPVMIAPKWLKTKCQPIAIKDVLAFLTHTIFHKKTYNQSFDIGGPDVLTYKTMLLKLAEARQLKRRIITVPVMSPRLSSYWLYFVTSTSYKLAQALVDSMKIEVVAKDNQLQEILNISPMSYHKALEKAFIKIEQQEVASSWKDAYSSSDKSYDISEFIKVPTKGCYIDKREEKITSRKKTLDNIWAVGGENGWYAQLLWQFRGFLDKMVGGVGLRRGRTNKTKINTGDALDFWRVLYADKEKGRLLLFAEMKLPGEAWLEFKVEDDKLIQTATFRPLGLAGRLYWYSVLPFHGVIFKGMIKELAN